ncbi:MAG TPA: hypothetical protein VM077_06000 [Candidatus Limnocylindrales bacterium]|nr:hypothetical protein [Candidatus Limnocylindrales bacterium]
MLINNIHVSKSKNLIHLSANIKFKNQKADRMYFSTSSINASLISYDYSPFLASVLLPCMKKGEDIVIDGTVSKKLLVNIEKIMDLVTSWGVGFKHINIQSGITNHAYLKNKRTSAAFFSAGVDSFYTYLKHKKTNSKIQNLILIHGFDIPLENKNLFTKTKKIVESIALEEKIKAISVTTNAGEIVEKVLIWDLSHGGVLAAVGLFLGKGIGRVYIPGGLKKSELFPYGTYPELDKLWSTEKTQFLHDGTEYNRLGKIMHVVSKSDLALKHLRVCTQNIKGNYNCSRCYKCLITMIGLVCSNSLQSAKTFKKLDLNNVKNMYYDYRLKYNLQGEANLEILKKENREHELQEAIKYSLENSKKQKIHKKLFEVIASFDQKYNERRLYRFVFKMNKKQDRNLIFKTLGKIGALK